VSWEDDACISEGKVCRGGTTKKERKKKENRERVNNMWMCDALASPSDFVVADLNVTYLVVVRTTVGSRADPSETPCIDQSIEGVVVAVLEEERHHHALEEIGLEDFPTASMWHPRDDVMKLFLGEDGVEFDGEFLDANGALEVPSVVAAATATAAASSRGIVVTGVGLFRHVAEVTVFVEGAWFRVSFILIKDQRWDAGPAMACCFLFLGIAHTYY